MSPVSAAPEPLEAIYSQLSAVAGRLPVSPADEAELGRLAGRLPLFG